MDTAVVDFRHLDKIDNMSSVVSSVRLPTHSLEELKNIEKKGVRLYRTQPVLRDIATFMEHPENIAFYERYFTNEKYFNKTMSLLRLYRKISKCLDAHPAYNFNAYFKIFILYNILQNREYCRLLIK